MSRSRRPRARLALLASLVAFAAVPVSGALHPLTAHAAGPCSAWMDTSLTPDQRAQALVSAMTIDQKVAMTTQVYPIWTHNGTAGYVPGQPALCIPDLVLNDAGQGVGDFDSLGGTNVTAFPAPIAQGASWDPMVQNQFGSMLGWEAFNKGVNVQLAPAIETNRVPMNGRNWEYVSEDPYLSGQTAVAETQGLQSQHVIATIKHYVANSQETNRMTDSADVAERTLYEMYYPQYQAAVQQGGAGAVMCSYNRINSVYACENPTTLKQALDTQMGFTGFVMSDWNATHSTVASALAGLDMEMAVNPGTFYGAPLKAAVQANQVPQAVLDDMILRITRSMFRIGLFDNPLPSSATSTAANVDTTAAQALARTIADNGTVLLKNGGSVLPIPGGGKKIAVIGYAAGPSGAELTYNGGGTASSGHIPEAGNKPVTSPLVAIQQVALGNGDTVTYTDGAATADAAAAAAAADVAVVFAYDQEMEGSDRPNLSLPMAADGANQDALIAAVAAANPNTAVVLETGGPVLMPWLNQVKGVLEAWYPGQEEGNAIADVLFGAVNPSGHLPQSFPVSESQLPAATPAQYPGVTQPGDAVGPHSAYSEGLDVGYRWFDDHGLQPLFPFGFGLSYTTFAYSNYLVSSPAGPGAPATVSFDVTNTGQRAGAEVAQVYVGSPANNYVNEPLHQLRAYQKTGVLTPGQTQHISLSIDSHAVSYWDATSHGWQAESGCHPVWVGGSSRDIELQGTGLDQSLAAVANCPASVSTYTVTPPTQVPEARAVPLMLAGPVALLVLAGAASRRRRRALRGAA